MSIDPHRKLLIRRRTKIVATLGPASADSEVIRQLVDTGIDVVRLNMSHGDHDGHQIVYERVRAAADAAGIPIAILADLGGPKIRIGEIKGGKVSLQSGAPVTITARDVAGHTGLIPIRYPRLGDELQPGNRVLIDDGKVELTVETTDGDDLRCVVVDGGVVSNAKGVNLPDTELSLPSMTDKDFDDARFAIDLGVDYLALSFVRQASDIEELRDCIGDDSTTRIIAKIEKPEALHNIDAILAATDAIMVARGDLGVELPPETVPAVQDELVKKARAQHKPVIIATQMLESMIHEARPTRAEVADVAHAVNSGTDAVMLSAETAVGSHPVAAVEIMDRVIRQTEASMWANNAFQPAPRTSNTGAPPRTHEAVGEAVAQLSRHLAVRAIVVVSRSGTSGMVVSSARPAAPMLAVSAHAATSRLMNLFWGVVPIRVEPAEMDDPVPLLRRLVQRLELAKPGDQGLIVRGFRRDPATDQPSITVVTV